MQYLEWTLSVVPVSLFCWEKSYPINVLYYGVPMTFCCCSWYCLSRISLLDKTENWRPRSLCISALNKKISRLNPLYSEAMAWSSYIVFLPLHVMSNVCYTFGPQEAPASYRHTWSPSLLSKQSQFNYGPTKQRASLAWTSTSMVHDLDRG